jgi:gamma-glutamyltranspeptidase/glutathione hydrolase
MRSARHVEDARLGVRGVGHDPRLGARQRDGAVAEVVDGHGAQGAGHALAGRQQHVHLARVGVRRDLVGVGDEAVGLLAARAEDGHDAVPGLALGDDALGGALEALGVGHRGASELHDDGCAVHDEGRRIRGVRPVGRARPCAACSFPSSPPARRRPGRRPPDARPTKQPTAVGVGGGAATVDPQATQAAIDVLRRGGNAVDAAIAASECARRRRAYSCGIGGGGFMTVYTARDGKVHTIDARETAPAAMNDQSFVGLQSFENQRVSGMSVGVPGHAAGVAEGPARVRDVAAEPRAAAGHRGRPARLHGRPDLLQPDRRGEGDLRRLPGHRGALPRPRRLAARRRDRDQEPRPRAHLRADRAQGRRLPVLGPAGAGDRRHRQAPAAAPGRDAGAAPGVMELSDLAAYKALDRDPTHIGYRGLDVYGMAPPSSGGSTVGEILNILEGYPDLGTMPRERALHLYLEASRLAYADRGAFVADPAT